MSKKDDKKLTIILGLKACLAKEPLDAITTCKIAEAADMTLNCKII